MNEYHMIREVREQSQAFSDILRSRSRIAEIVHELAKKVPRSYYAVGCGSSYYAAMIGAFYHEYMFGLDSRAFPSSEFVWYAPITNLPSPVVIALSRSGRTSETVEAARKAKKLKLSVIGLTSDLTSPLGQESEYSLDIGVKDEKSVIMTKSFTASTLVTILIGYEFAKLQGTVLKQFDSNLAQLPEDANKVIQTVDEQTKKTAETISKISRFIYLGSGGNYPACLEGALKLRETSYTSSEAYHTLEVRHGPFAQLQKGIGVIAIVTEDQTIKQTETLLKQIAATGATVIPISNVPRVCDSYEQSIRMPESLAVEFTPILSMIPMQMLAYYYTLQHGVNPDVPRNLTRFVTTDIAS